MSILNRFIFVVLIGLMSWMPTSLPVFAAQPSLTYTVRYHPDGPLYIGDQISFEVISPPGIDLNKDHLQVSLSKPGGQELGKAGFTGFINGRFRAILQWAWDTKSLSPGSYTLTFNVPEKGQSWQEIVRLLPAPPGLLSYHWATAETDCCLVHYITGTAAARDLPELLPAIQAQARDVTQRMGIQLNKKMEINLIPRLLGQGGFTSDEVYISYRDNNYVNSDTSQLIHHELIHMVDGQIKSDLRPSFLVEGLAVYLSGGHYQPEPVMLRASSLLDTGEYIALPYLIDHFYSSQHESGYIEGGALVEYMVDTWGLDKYFAFYRDIHPAKDGRQSTAIDAALTAHFGLTLRQLESQFIGNLERNPEVPDIRQDVDNSILLYDTIRQYQKELDPSAYFEQVWLPDARQMRAKGIVADYLRSPDQPLNHQVEALLFSAGNDLRSGNFNRTLIQLDQVETILNDLHPYPAELAENKNIQGISGAMR